MSDLEFHQFLCRKDNYGVLVHDPASGDTASIDAPDSRAVATALAEKRWQLTHILVTHHHADHTAGIPALKAQTECRVVGPRAEAARIVDIDDAVGDGDRVAFGGRDVHVLDTPGHTLGHISYWIGNSSVAFVGDTLFALGCGRVFEGSYEMMWRSLQKISALPPETQIYCGHEYTLANARFSLTIEPDNAALQKRAIEIEALRAENRPTLPTRLAIEQQTNPFLRPHSPEIRARLMLPSAPDWKVFAEIRERKNRA